jgi:hypothetical protein
MVAFVDDDMTIAGNLVRHASLPDDALDHGYIERPGHPALPPTDLSDLFLGKVEEESELSASLIQELRPVN